MNDPLPPVRFDIGDVMRRSVNILVNNAGLFLGITALLYAPLILANLGSELLTSPLLEGLVDPDSGGDLAGFQQLFVTSGVIASAIAALTWLVVLPLSQAAIIHGVFRTLQGRAPSMDACVRTATSRWAAVLGAVILVGILRAIGTMMCVIPGFVVWAIFCMTVPAVVVEGVGPATALSRSDWLTQGNRWALFFLLVILAVLEGAAQAAGAGLAGLVEFSGAAPYIRAVITGALSIVAAAFQNVVLVVAYYDLRLLRDEDLVADELLSVFD